MDDDKYRFQEGPVAADWTPGKDRVDIEKVLESVHLFKWQYKNGNGELLDLWIGDVELY